MQGPTNREEKSTMSKAPLHSGYISYTPFVLKMSSPFAPFMWWFVYDEIINFQMHLDYLTREFIACLNSKIF